MAAKKKVMDQPPAPRAGGGTMEAKGGAARAPETKGGAGAAPGPAAGGKGARSGTGPK